MGLDLSHECWHGAYSAFMAWRKKLMETAGLPPLTLMEGFYDEMDYVSRFIDRLQESRFLMTLGLPIKWECLKPDVLHILINHSDTDGIIENKHCGDLAERLAELLPLLPDGGNGGHIWDWKEVTQKFIDGLLLAHKRGEKITFR